MLVIQDKKLILDRNSFLRSKSTGIYKILSDNGRITIPFEFYSNKFRFKTSVNGRTCNMLLDNGSLWDELLFFGAC